MTASRLVSGLVAASITGALLFGTGYRPRALPGTDGQPATAPTDAVERSKQQKREAVRHRKLLAAVDRSRPRGVHLVIDQTHNRLYLKRGDELLREAVCSAGSGLVLSEYGGKRQWTFDTPRGVFRIRQKVTNPVWTKPDWAFVEEGLPIPRDPSKRVERGVLGAYALPFGEGYLIHGTLYTRLLGQSTSHGCIRLGDDDLDAVFHAVAVGTPIFIY